MPVTRMTVRMFIHAPGPLGSTRPASRLHKHPLFLIAALQGKFPDQEAVVLSSEWLGGANRLGSDQALTAPKQISKRLQWVARASMKTLWGGRTGPSRSARRLAGESNEALCGRRDRRELQREPTER
jgi:hypothetical protein